MLVITFGTDPEDKSKYKFQTDSISYFHNKQGLNKEFSAFYNQTMTARWW